MAKAKTSEVAPASPSKGERHSWEVDDALRTLTRAEEVKDDKGLMRDVAKKAREQAADMTKIADRLAGKGLISDKQREKMAAKAA